MPLTPEQYEHALDYRAAAQTLADELRNRIGDEAWQDVTRLIDVNEAPLGLNQLAHVIARLRRDAVSHDERQRLFDLVHGTDELPYLPESFRRMTPSTDAWWLSPRDRAT